MLFLIKIGFSFKNPLVSNKQQNGLTYSGNATVGELVNKDTDGDGIPDWEESLYGLDPTKKETTPGIPDSVAMERLKAQNQQGLPSLNNQGPVNLTQTDKFSQSLLATVTTLSQNGGMDQNTADSLGNSLASQIQNTPVRKVYLLADLKTIKDNGVKAVQNYSDTLNSIFQKNPTKYTILDILQKFSADANNVDPSVLKELDPNIKQIKGFIDGMIKISVPSSLAFFHLDVLNDFEKVLENLNDIQLYDTDPIVALGGMTKYNNNATSMMVNTSKLIDAINLKLKTP